MSRATFLRLFVAVFVLQGAWAVYTQTAKPPGPLRTQQVKGDLHMISGEGGNVALYATSDGVILVDDMFDRNHADILAQVKTVTDKPLKYVINTHQHDDHAGGDFKMLPIAEVIAHRNVYANLKDLKRPYYEDTPGTPIGLPRITFTDQLDVHLGGKDVQAYYFGRGHTSGDAVIYFPELNGHSHRRSVPGDSCWRARRGAREAAAPGRADLCGLRPGRQLHRVVEDARGRVEAGLRHRDPRTRSRLDQGRPGEVQVRSRDDARPADRADQTGQHEGGDREDPRRRLRLALDGMSAEPADGRMSAVSAGGRA